MRRGFSLVEIVVAVAVLLVSFVSIIGAFQAGVRSGRGSTEKIQAASLAEEGIEAATTIRDAGWSGFASFATDVPYDPVWNGSAWTLAQSPYFLDGMFRRTVSFESVYRRDSDKDIVASTSPDAKSLDQNTRKIIVRVSWATTTPSGGGAETLESYLINLFE